MNLNCFCKGIYMTEANEFDYKKYLNLINKKKRLFILVALLIMTAAVIISYIIPRKYQAQSTVFIEKSVVSDLVKGLAVSPTVEDKMKALNYSLTSRTLIRKVIDDLDMKLKKYDDAALEELIKEFSQNTEIKLKDKEGLFIITYVDNNPRIARDFVNTLVRRYIEENVSFKREDTYGATKFLSEQMQTFKEKLDKAESASNAYKSQKSGVLSASETQLSMEIESSRQKLEELAARHAQLESSKKMLQKSDSLQVKLATLQSKLDELRATYTESYPEIIKVKTDIESLEEQIRKRQASGQQPLADAREIEKIDSDLRIVKTAEDNQRRMIAVKQGMLQGIPTAKAKLEELEREHNNQKSLYEQLLTRQGQSEVSKQMEVQDKSVNFRIVDPAVIPIKPVSPNRVRIILLGIIGGIAGAFGVLLLLDYMDHSIKSTDALKGLGIPVLALIPKMENPDEISREQKRDRKIYKLAGAYFLVVLAVLTIEILQIPLLDKVLDRIGLG